MLGELASLDLVLLVVLLAVVAVVPAMVFGIGAVLLSRLRRGTSVGRYLLLGMIGFGLLMSAFAFVAVFAVARS